MGYIIGADEVGRGCVAGDVYVAAVMVDADAPRVEGVRDSKKLSPAKRELASARLLADPNVRYRVATRSAADVDRRGISTTLRECFEEAVGHLEGLGLPVEEVRVDGNPFPLRTTAPLRFIVKGDDSEYVIGAASIVAKVARDAYMVRMGAEHPGYGFETHAGYGTPAHVEAIKAKGLSPIHRATFCKAWVTISPRAVEVFDDPSIVDLFG
jgi:ribonuclease HII